tara:strand:- start:199 stop:1185 length:987 start_codon:yes stop_codon:yes gene_type:complete
MTQANQGFRQDLNLSDNKDQAVSLNNLAGAGIDQDIAILVNNLRNTGTIGYSTFGAPGTNPDNVGFFTFFPAREYVFTNDDVVQVSVNVDVGSTTLSAGTDYYVCESDTLNKFKLSFYPESEGTEIISVTSVGTTDFNFIRKEPVHRENIVNFIQPEILDDENFSYLSGGEINDIFEGTLSNIENATFFVGKKYKGTDDTATDEEIKYEGILKLDDPTNLNSSTSGLADPKSPGVFIGNTRAFSADNNPWSERVDGGAGSGDLQTSSEEVTIGELFFNEGRPVLQALNNGDLNNDVTTGLSLNVTSFTHKIPIVVDGETYFLCLKEKP